MFCTFYFVEGDIVTSQIKKKCGKLPIFDEYMKFYLTMGRWLQFEV